jgi:hypothetical protein
MVDRYRFQKNGAITRVVEYQGLFVGHAGCLFDEIGNLVEPAERRHMDVPAG